MITNITIDKAHEILLNQRINTQLIELHILESLDYVLGEDIASNMNLPPFDRSPLDGYAYRSQDTLLATGDSPVILEVIDNLQAGHITEKKIEKGQAMRIMTGAKIPAGADVVMMYELTEFTKDQVKIFTSLKANSNIAKMAEDMKVGELVLEKGITIGPAEIGILASLGKSHVMVYAKPKVAILATGDELVSIYDELEEGKIRNSNSYFLAAQIKKLGAEPVMLGIAKDNLKDTADKISSALKWADMIITTGGASVGDADIIKEAFQEIGASIIFWKVMMKPGTPIIAAKYEDKFLFGLSGNPAAAYITFEKFVRPSILRTMGKEQSNFMKVNSILEDEFPKLSKQNRYVRAFTYKKDGKYYTKLPSKNSSGVLSSMAGKNSLLLIPGGTGPYKSGDRVEVELINNLELEQ